MNLGGSGHRKTWLEVGAAQQTPPNEEDPLPVSPQGKDGHGSAKNCYSALYIVPYHDFKNLIYFLVGQ